MSYAHKNNAIKQVDPLIVLTNVDFWPKESRTILHQAKSGKQGCTAQLQLICRTLVYQFPLLEKVSDTFFRPRQLCESGEFNCKLPTAIHH